MSNKPLIYKTDNQDTLHCKDDSVLIECHENGNIEKEFYYTNGKLHNENGPAIIWYFENGNIESESFYINGKLHKENGPAIIFYNENGKTEDEYYYLNDINVTRKVNNWLERNNLKMDKLTPNQLIKRKIEIGI